MADMGLRADERQATRESRASTFAYSSPDEKGASKLPMRVKIAFASEHGRRRPYIAGGCIFFALGTLLLLGPGILSPSWSPLERPWSLSSDWDDSLKPDYLWFNTTSNSSVSCLLSEVTCESGENTSAGYWYGCFFVFFYFADTLCNVPYNALGPELTEDYQERSSLYFVQNIIGMCGTLIGAAGPPALEVALGSRDTSFFVIGLFFGTWYIISQLNLVRTIEERKESQKKRATPLVPSIMRCFRNHPFQVLVVTWVIDFIGWFAVAATMPFYLKYVIRPSAYSAYSDETWLGVSLMLFFAAAILSMPLWLFASKRFGKRKTWLFYNAMNGVTNACFIFCSEGDVGTMLLVTAMNGAPLGGKFLVDSILGDVIDDEFLSGERREAQFTMFASFIPKLVSIPSQALPLALINAVGFIPSVGGKSQEQPSAVVSVITLVYVGFPVVLNFVSFFIKLNFPMTSEEQTKLISEGITLHARGLPAFDPLEGKMVQLKKANSQADEKDFFLLEHFRKTQIMECVVANSNDYRTLVNSMKKSTALGATVFVTSVIGVVQTFPLLQNQALSWAPSLLQICVGVSSMFVIFSVLRLRAAWQLVERNLNPSLVKKYAQPTVQSAIRGGGGEEEVNN